MMRAIKTLLVAVCSLAGLVSATTTVSADDADSAYIELPIDQYDRDHWAFSPFDEPETPDLSNKNWCRNEIDRFVAHRLNQRGLSPQPSASRRTLIRRLSFDLTGLPPTPRQIDDFVCDSRPNAYKMLVDRLLESPQYGERWAQHWLDLARFAETDGFEHDKIRKDAWKYRDWVIDSLNNDMPYDEFIRRQLAGDEIYPDDESATIATRFCLCGPDMPDINLIEERRHAVLNELTSTVGEVLLGLQVGCAQCHDHKYDAISQADFYRLRAVFEPAVSLTKNRSLESLKEVFPFRQPSRLMLRGDFRSPGPEVSPGVIRVVSTEGNVYSPSPSEESAGLRTALAKWLTSSGNPLTARVMVNRIWQHHFGTGLVDTSSDFGVMGDDPSHPELLDWLATKLVQRGWKLKPMHRMIVMSATYRQRSRLADDATATEMMTWTKAINEDASGRLLSRYPRWRLEGEAIRDAILLAAGQIHLKSGGPGIRPPLPKELVSTLLKNQWNVTEDESEHTRRSIYVFARRNLRYPIFEVFDRPSANASCPKRGISTTAPQSLHLLNSAFSLDMSRAMATSIMEGTQTNQIEAAFLRTLGRPPSDPELNEARKFLSETNESDQDGLDHLCLALINCNEFVTID